MARRKYLAQYKRWICRLSAVYLLYFALAQLIHLGPLADIKTNTIVKPASLRSLWQLNSGLDREGITLVRRDGAQAGAEGLVANVQVRSNDDLGRVSGQHGQSHGWAESRYGTTASDSNLQRTTAAQQGDHRYYTPTGQDYQRVAVNALNRNEAFQTGGTGVLHSGRRTHGEGLKHISQRPTSAKRKRTAQGLHIAGQEADVGDDLEGKKFVNVFLPYKDDGEEDDKPTERVVLEHTSFEFTDQERASGSRYAKRAGNGEEPFRGTHVHRPSQSQLSAEREDSTTRSFQHNDHVLNKAQAGVLKKRPLPNGSFRDPDGGFGNASQSHNQGQGEEKAHYFGHISLRKLYTHFNRTPAPPPPKTKEWPVLNKFRARITKPPGCFRILLIIIFNGAHYQNIPFLLRYYHHGFKHIVFYGRIEMHLPPVPRFHPEEIVVRRTLDRSGGYYQQWTIAQAMSDYPSFDGYLWVGDDVYLNFPELLTTMDPTKFWLNHEKEVNGIFAGYRYDNTDPHCWPNWAKAYGIPAVRKAFKKIPQRFVRKMVTEFGKANSVIKSFSDVGYIPHAFVKDVYSLLYILRDVIFEIALPTTCHLASRYSDRQYFRKPVYLWYTGQRKEPGKFINLQTTFLHPIKYSVNRSRKVVLKWMQRIKHKLNFGKSPPKRYKC